MPSVFTDKRLKATDILSKISTTMLVIQHYNNTIKNTNLKVIA